MFIEKYVNKEEFVKRQSNITYEYYDTFTAVNIGITVYSNKIYSVGLEDVIFEYSQEYFKNLGIYALIYFSYEQIMCYIKTHDHNIIVNFFKGLIKYLRSKELLSSLKLICGAYVVKDIEEITSEINTRALLARQENEKLNNVLFFNEAILKRHLNDVFVTENFSDALTNGDILLYLQPKYDAISGKICGAEALTRWKTPEGEILMPGFFINSLEKSGRIIYLDRYVLERTCEFIGNRLKENLKVVPISVNFSQKHNFDDGLIQFITETADKYKIPHNLIHIEITESTTSKNKEDELRALNILRDLGFIVELDDFGVGYSNLEMLTRMPIDIIKIDKILFENIQDKNFIYFYSCVISLAHKLGLKVTIEGVENIGHLQTIKSLDVDYIQGFYFSRPVTVENFISILNKEDIESIDVRSIELLPFDLESLKRIFEYLSNPVMIVKVNDYKMSYLYVNDAYAQIYNIPPRDFINKDPNNIIGPCEDLFKTFQDISMTNKSKEFYDITRNNKRFFKYTLTNIAPGYVCCIMEQSFTDNKSHTFGVLVLELLEDTSLRYKYVSERIIKENLLDEEEFKKCFENIKTNSKEVGLYYKDVRYLHINNKKYLMTYIVRSVYGIDGKVNFVCYINDITEYIPYIKES